MTHSKKENEAGIYLFLYLHGYTVIGPHLRNRHVVTLLPPRGLGQTFYFAQLST